MNINYDITLYILKIMIAICFMSLCTFIVAQFYFLLYNTIEKENLKDAINETLEMVNANE